MAKKDKNVETAVILRTPTTKCLTNLQVEALDRAMSDLRHSCLTEVCHVVNEAFDIESKLNDKLLTDTLKTLKTPELRKALSNIGILALEDKLYSGHHIKKEVMSEIVGETKVEDILREEGWRGHYCNALRMYHTDHVDEILRALVLEIRFMPWAPKVHEDTLDALRIALRKVVTAATTAAKKAVKEEAWLKNQGLLADKNS